jgi:hypothetical protein
VLMLALARESVAALTTSGVKQDTETLLQQIAQVQDDFYYLAIALQNGQKYGLGSLPKPDWVLRADGNRAKTYDELLSSPHALQLLDPAYLALLRNTKYVYHWDELRAHVYPEDCLTSPVMKRMGDGSLFYDPFSQGYYGYAGSGNDFALVSVGPDRRPDLLGFYQYRGTQDYRFVDSTESTASQLRNLKARLFHGDFSDWNTSVVIPIDAYYDPTNGLWSRGDIIFHGWDGDNLLFSYNPNRPLRCDTLIKRAITTESLCGARFWKVGPTK